MVLPLSLGRSLWFRLLLRLSFTLSVICPSRLSRRRCWRDILPAVSRASSEDWHLGPLLQFSEAPLALRTALLDVPLWHEAPLTINATHLEVFTDGSASGPSEPLRTAPAGWAFTVWVVAGQRSYFYGAAYSTAVPPGTPFYLGETRDTPLQSELLGICWALVWLFEYGPA